MVLLGEVGLRDNRSRSRCSYEEDREGAESCRGTGDPEDIRWTTGRLVAYPCSASRNKFVNLA